MKCRICDHTELNSVIDLGQHPWANNFIRPEDVHLEKLYPLHLVYCPVCQCAQLNYTVPKETMFSDHTYVSGTTLTLCHHFKETAELMDTQFFRNTPHKSILDIGSNDGTQLKQYQTLGYDVLGVESCRRVAEIAIANGVPTVIDFFNQETAETLGRKFDLVNASGVFFHLEELHSVAEGIRHCLDQNGVFVAQFLYMKSIMDNLAFDQIYHEHLLYYTIKTISRLLAYHQLEPFDAYFSPIHGGSIVLMSGHKGRHQRTQCFNDLVNEEEQSKVNDFASYQAFAARIYEKKTLILAYLEKAKSEGLRIYGLGAPVKGNTLLNYFRIGTNLLSCLTEKNALRKGLVSPGMHIPIVLEDDIVDPPDVYFVLAWNFLPEIIARNAPLIQRGVQFYSPITGAVH
jgi:SAM-dependent methyltransferase